ncbi:MAG: hypothetical protein ACE5F7_04990 [Nitrospiria bacterium]
MPAFNNRYKLKKIGHVPAYSVGGLIGMIITGPLSLPLPMPYKMLPVVLFFVCLFIVVFFIRVGDELPFLPVKRASRRERNRVTSETWTDA